MDKTVKKLFQPKASSREVFVALEDKDPDRRREAIANVASSDMVAEDWAIKAFSVVARTDPDTHVRCAAIRALQRSGRPEAAEPILQILTWQQHRDKVPYPPDDQVRWDATAVLAAMCSWSLIPDDMTNSTKLVLLRLLADDTNHNVRLEAARGLGYFHGDREILRALVTAMDDQDFGVVYEAEQSLVLLTGVTHDCDPDAWVEWLNHSEDPFARAGQPPESMTPDDLTWWQRSTKAAQKALIAWQGESKTD